MLDMRIHNNANRYLKLYMYLDVRTHSNTQTNTFATLANATLETSWLLHLTHINKGLDTPTLHMPRTCSVSAPYQCLHPSPRLRHWPSLLIPFVPNR
jgi:hypothetical protein